MKTEQRIAARRLALALMAAGVLCFGSISYSAAQATGEVPEALQGIDVIERFGEAVPMDAVFTNASGEQVRLGDYFDGETPVILNFVYHDCPMLCSLVLDGLTAGMQDLAWTAGREFEVLTISISAVETPAMARAAKERYLDRLGRAEAARGWHFLVGDEAAIQALSEAVGFQFKWDPRIEQYAHPAVLTFLTGEGRVARYYYGIEFPEFQLRAALVETSDGSVGSFMDKLILRCYMYDPDAQSYTADIMRIMQIVGALFVLLLAGTLFWFWRRELQPIHARYANDSA